MAVFPIVFTNRRYLTVQLFGTETAGNVQRIFADEIGKSWAGDSRVDFEEERILWKFDISIEKVAQHTIGNSQVSKWRGHCAEVGDWGECNVWSDGFGYFGLECKQLEHRQGAL